MKIGVVVFPGSNCDHDTYHVLKDELQAHVEYIWHKETTLRFFDAIVLPGGFSYGDYLRAGALARFSPVMQAVIGLARQGVPVLGICNGFQVLLEAGLLPGALLANDHLRFRCQTVTLRVSDSSSCFTRAYQPGQLLRMPIAHYHGNYHAPADTLHRLQEEALIAFQYCDRSGELSPAANPNGSALNIAGIYNPARNVLGMMPHPERASSALLGSTDGMGIFKSLLGN